MNTRQLAKQLDKEYWKNKQNLLISTIEVIDYNTPNSGPYCVYTINPKTEEFETYCFEIQNYNAFYEDIYPIDKSILYPEKFEYKQRFDSDKASCAVFYNARERLYTIPKFTSITREDVLRCFKHFTRKVLDGCFLWNISWHEFKEGQYKTGEEQYELEFMHSKQN
jgi:hypothetical protein